MNAKASPITGVRGRVYVTSVKNCLSLDSVYSVHSKPLSHAGTCIVSKKILDRLVRLSFVPDHGTDAGGAVASVITRTTMS